MRLRSGNTYRPEVPRQDFNTFAPRSNVVNRGFAPPERAYPIDLGKSSLPIQSFDGSGNVIDFLDRFDLLAKRLGCRC